MIYSEDTPTGGICPECGYTDGHNVVVCPLVLSVRAKAMPGLSPEAVEHVHTEKRRNG
jgi:hypothetical protein